MKPPALLSAAACRRLRSRRLALFCLGRDVDRVTAVEDSAPIVLLDALGPGTSAAMPLVGFKAPAGFPSPSADFQVDRVDLQERLELDKPYVFLARVSGSSMTGLGIDDGDLIVVNRNLAPRHGQIVVAVIDNELTCKTLYQMDGVVKLLAANPDYPDILPKEGQEWSVWGVVTSCVKSFPV